MGYGFKARGYLAALLTTFSSIPQIIRVYKMKESKGLSLWTVSSLSAGVLLWVVHGIISTDLPVILANSVFLLLTALTCCFVLKNS